MKRRISWTVAALLASGIVTASTASGATPTDVSNHAITCKTVTGTAKFKPPLNDVGTSGVEIKIKGKLRSCVDTTDGAVMIDSGTFAGTLSGPTSFCPDLITTFQPAVATTGTLTYRWKANRTTPITPTQSAQTVNTRTSDLFAPAGCVEPTTTGGTFGSENYVTLSFGTASVSGAFTGGDGGVTSSNIIVTSEDFSLIQALCASGMPPRTGLKSVTFGIGTVTLK